MSTLQFEPMTREVDAHSPAVRVPYLDRLARRSMLAVARRIRVGRLTIVLPDGTTTVVGDPGPDASSRHPLRPVP